VAIVVKGFMVSSTPDTTNLRVDRVVGQDRRVSIQTGAAKVPGVRAESTSVATYDFPANASGQPRLDWLVMRFSWSADPGTCVITHVQGTPAATPQRPALTQTAGVQWDLPLALVRVDAGVGAFPADAVSDARYWAMDGATAVQARIVDPPARPGRLLYVVSTGELLHANGSSWAQVGPTAIAGTISQSSGWASYGQGYGVPSYRVSDGTVELSGITRRTGAAFSLAAFGVQIASLPAAARPSVHRVVGVLTLYGAKRITVRTNGAIELVNEGSPTLTFAQTTGWVALDGATYRL
jgi:hypothetical protein